ncbi:hypothetical protein C3L33_19164, partial [Rhododendron williamsianum]
MEAAGHQFTAVDLSACGADPKKLDEWDTVGGGIASAVAMEKYPRKISLAIFLTGIMPDTEHGPSYALDQYAAGTPADAWKDTQFSVYGDPNEPLTSLVVGPHFLKSTLYQLCPIEDFTLAPLMVRPGSLFIEDLHKIKKFTDEGFGSVTRVYVVCEQDKCIPPEFQRWMIENNPVKEVKVIEEADHMPMFSAPEKLCKCLLEIAAYKYIGGGIASAVAMEKYPRKISLAIFLTGIMPDTEHGPSYALDQYAAGTPADAWKDTQFSVYGDPNEPLTSLVVGPHFLKSTLYQLCPIEDFTLAPLMVRPGSLFIEDLHKIKKFTDEGFGSVTRVYVVCEQDKCIPPEFQRWMIENNPVKEVKVIEEADHMPMFSAPEKLCKCLLEIAAYKYST